MSEPLSWDQLRDAAKKITAQGQGQYYGVVIEGKQTPRFAAFINGLARMAGAAAGASFGFTEIDWRTGQHVYASDEFLAAVDLLLALKADGSIFPGSTSLNAPQARAQLPQGTAGMILQGPWNIPEWQRDNPDFKFGVASQPIPNTGAPTPLTYEETGANVSWVYAQSPYKAIAGDMFSYMSSVEGQVAMMAATGGNLGSIIPEAVQIAQDTLDLDPLASKALALFEEQLRVGPLVAIRNPEAAQVAFERKPLTPDFGEIVQGIFTGQLSDPGSAMQDLQDRADAELDRAIKAAQDKGAQVSRDDFVFPNWDPTRDYTEEDYAAL
ncbi:MAG: extracellular solute-binding protein [Chloroflexia bacterium]|nr:extracellular solute-binding protein [Chloroflexia bacterium]